MYDEERDWVARAREGGSVDVAFNAAGGGVLESVKDRWTGKGASGEGERRGVLAH